MYSILEIVLRPNFALNQRNKRIYFSVLVKHLTFMWQQNGTN